MWERMHAKPMVNTSVSSLSSLPDGRRHGCVNAPDGRKAWQAARYDIAHNCPNHACPLNILAAVLDT